ncbi:MAG: hypothetical protein AAF443_07665 [Chlamydiota bacterium]
MKGKQESKGFFGVLAIDDIAVKNSGKTHEDIAQGLREVWKCVANLVTSKGGILTSGM